MHLTQQSPLGLPCSGEKVILQCTLREIIVFWSFPGGEITLASDSRDVKIGNFQLQPVGMVDGEFTSTLTFPAENGTVITCINGLDRSRNDTQAVQVQGNSTKRLTKLFEKAITVIALISYHDT